MCTWWCACARNMRHLSFAHCAWRMKSCLSLSRVSEYGLTMCCCVEKIRSGSVGCASLTFRLWSINMRLKCARMSDATVCVCVVLPAMISDTICRGSEKPLCCFFFLPKTAVVVARESIITSELMLFKLRGHGWNTHSLNYRVHKRFTIVIIGINYFRIYSHSDNLCSDSQ